MTYQPGVPTGTVNLDVDYQNLQTNFQQLDTQFGIDHIPFSNTSGTPPGGVNGYHQYVHFNPFSTTATNPPNNYTPSTAAPVAVPTATPGFGQLFSCQVNDGLAADESLYWKSGGNRLIPLTRNLTPVSATNGYTCLPGGLILQWGLKSVGGPPPTAGTVTFSSSNIAFPNACFTVNCVMEYTGGSGSPNSASSVSVTGLTKIKFDFTISGSSNFAGFYWLAIGN